MKLLIFLLEKYWIHHKKQAFSIILSISILVSAIMCCMLVARSQLLQSYNENLDNYGGYDVCFCNVNDDIINQLQQEDVIKDIGSIGIVGKIGLNYVNVTYGYLENDIAEDLMHLPIESGRLPKNSGEIAIEKSTLSAWGITTLTGIEVTLETYSCSSSYHRNIRKWQEYTVTSFRWS